MSVEQLIQLLADLPPARVVAILRPVWAALPPAGVRAVRSDLQRIKLPAPGRAAFDFAEIRRWLDNGRSQRWMARKMGISQATMSRAIARARKEGYL